MRALQFLGSRTMLAAMASGLAVACVMYVAFAVTLRKVAPDWDPFTWQIKAAPVAFFVIFGAGVAVDVFKGRRAVR